MDQPGVYLMVGIPVMNEIKAKSNNFAGRHVAVFKEYTLSEPLGHRAFNIDFTINKPHLNSFGREGLAHWFEN